MTESANEYAARIRAARAYAGVNQEDVADAIGVSLATMKRLELGRSATTRDRLDAIAYACGVPVEFMRHGFGPPDLIALEARLYTVEVMLGIRRDG